MLRKIIKSEDS